MTIMTIMMLKYFLLLWYVNFCFSRAPTFGNLPTNREKCTCPKCYCSSCPKCSDIVKVPKNYIEKIMGCN